MCQCLAAADGGSPKVMPTGGKGLTGDHFFPAWMVPESQVATMTSATRTLPLVFKYSKALLVPAASTKVDVTLHYLTMETSTFGKSNVPLTRTAMEAEVTATEKLCTQKKGRKRVSDGSSKKKGSEQDKWKAVAKHLFK